MRKAALFLCCLASLLLTCSCGKRKMTEAEKEQLLSLYPKLFHSGDPVQIDIMSNQILAAVSKDNPDMGNVFNDVADIPPCVLRGS